MILLPSSLLVTMPSFKLMYFTCWGVPRWCTGKESACQCWRHKRCRFNPWVWKTSWGRKWESTPVFLPGESPGQRSLAGCRPWGCKAMEAAEHVHTHISHIIYMNIQNNLLIGFQTKRLLMEANKVMVHKTVQNYVIGCLTLNSHWRF